MGIDFLTRQSGQYLILPFYHAVSDNIAAHLKHLYPITSVKRFEQDLDFLLKNYKTVPLTSLGKALQEQTKSFFLSFDDGLREFYEYAVPVLLKKGIPVTCFINSAFVDNKDMFYRMKASILIEELSKNKSSIAEEKNVAKLFNALQLEYKIPFDLLKINYQQRHILNDIADLIGFSFEEYRNTNKPYLTSVQINELKEKGISFGSHSVSHPCYAELGEEEQILQTVDCLHFLKERFDIDERVFSFPFTDYGVKKSFFDSISKETDWTFGTANMKLDSIQTNLQRIPMEIEGIKNAENLIKKQYFYFIIKKMLGRHIINRE